jgi:peptide/nickel transport system substrate-binding protein
MIRQKGRSSLARRAWPFRVGERGQSRAPRVLQRAVCWSLLVVVVAIVSIPGAALGRVGGAEAVAKPVLRIGVARDPANLDPAVGLQSVVFDLAYESLIDWSDVDGSLRPGLAVSWRFLPAPARSGLANKRFELTLRRNVRFSDGTPLMAQAVKTWLEYFPTKQGPHSGLMTIKSIETIGRWTVRITTSIPTPTLPFLLARTLQWGMVASPKVVTSSPSLLGTRTFGAGPYVVLPSESSTGDHYTFVPNKFYYNKAAIKYSKIVVKVITNPSSMLQALQAGQLDAAVGNPTTADAAAAAGFRVDRGGGSQALIAFADLGGDIFKPLADVRVRRAMNYALDRKAITSASVGKWGTPTSQMANLEAYLPKYVNYYPYNPAKARALLAAAGYRSGFKVKVQDARFYGPTGVEAAAKFLDEVGVELDIAPGATAAEWSKAYRSKTVPLIWSSNEFTNAISNNYLEFLKSGYTGYSLQQHTWRDPVLDNLRFKGLRAAKPQLYWNKMIQRIVEQAYMIPLFHTNALLYVSKRVKGGLGPKGSWPFVPAWSPAE